MIKNVRLLGLTSLLAFASPAFSDDVLYYYGCGSDAAAAIACAGDACKKDGSVLNFKINRDTQEVLLMQSKNGSLVMYEVYKNCSFFNQGYWACESSFEGSKSSVSMLGGFIHGVRRHAEQKSNPATVHFCAKPDNTQ
jgi:hypothetical protein